MQAKQGDSLRASMLMRFEGIDDDVVTFIDALPPFGVLQMARVTWEQIACPAEVLVSITPTSSPENVR